MLGKGHALGEQQGEGIGIPARSEVLSIRDQPAIGGLHRILGAADFFRAEGRLDMDTDLGGLPPKYLSVRVAPTPLNVLVIPTEGVYH